MEKLIEKTISCVIPTYNRCPHKEQITKNPLFWSIYSLNNQPNIAEVIIVDDASKDFTEKTIKELDKKFDVKIKYIRNGERQGSGRGRNEGVQIADMNKIWFMDDDCVIVGKNVLSNLEYAFDFLSESSIEKVGAMTLPVSGNSLESLVTPSHEIGRVDRDKGAMLGCYTKFPREYLNGGDSHLINKEKEIYRPLQIELMGGVFLTSKQAFIEAGGFTKTPWRNACAEEPQLMLNMQSKGYKVYYLPSKNPKFRVFHCRYGDPSFRRIPYEMNIDGISFNDILKESSNERSNTGNRVPKPDELYSNVLSDMYIMFKFFGERVGLNNLDTKYDVIVNKKIFPEIKGDKRMEIFKTAVKEGLFLLNKERKISTGTQNYIDKVFIKSSYTS